MNLLLTGNVVYCSSKSFSFDSLEKEIRNKIEINEKQNDKSNNNNHNNNNNNKEEIINYQRGNSQI